MNFRLRCLFPSSEQILPLSELYVLNHWVKKKIDAFGSAPFHFHRSHTHLITSHAPGIELIGVVPTAVHPPLPEEVDVVHQQLPARAARKAPWVPALPGHARRDDAGRSGLHLSLAVVTRLQDTPSIDQQHVN